ncbi:MAG: H4MPT-linked C1 transfer pathway protein [Methanobrevibacter sp.]|nr:H4MPT-linked C1 transfer pathway protein [Methanobrevibacter sp.]
MKIAGFDIGGANTDLAVVDFNKDGAIENISTAFEYLPMWSDNHRLGEVLLKLIGEVDELSAIDGIGISMTAELVDAYETKNEGVIDIYEKVMEVFNVPVGFIGVNGFLSSSDAVKHPLELAAANWVGTASLIAEICENCIFVDIGSTTTDIIPIKNGKEVAKGRSDFERLATGELVYTGTLRTNLCSFLDEIELNNKSYNVASELFATTADIFTVLDKISPEDYSCATSDGLGKSKEEAMTRISRVLCADMETLSKDDIISVSNYIYKKQVEQIAKSLKKVCEGEELNKVITTGLGGNILGVKAAKLLGLDWESMDDYFTHEQSVVAPAIGTAVLVFKNFH